MPLNLTTTYKVAEENRSGILTPDEDLRRQLDGTDYETFDSFIGNHDLVGKMTITNFEVIVDDTLYTRFNYEYGNEAALVLCMATEASLDLQQRLGKKVCIEILDIDALTKSFDEQLGEKSIQRACEYTLDRNRNHFLKSDKDAWQNEYRLIWHNIKTDQWVTVPKGICKIVEL